MSFEPGCSTSCVDSEEVEVDADEVSTFHVVGLGVIPHDSCGKALSQCNRLQAGKDQETHTRARTFRCDEAKNIALIRPWGLFRFRF